MEVRIGNFLPILKGGYTALLVGYFTKDNLGLELGNLGILRSVEFRIADKRSFDQEVGGLTGK